MKSKIVQRAFKKKCHLLDFSCFLQGKNLFSVKMSKGDDLKIVIFSFSFLIINFSAFADFIPTSFTARFEQVYLSKLKGKVKKGTGKIDYHYPSRVRFETETPSHVLFMSNGEKNWYYTYPFIKGEKGELTTSSAGEGNFHLVKLFDRMKADLKSNELFQVTEEKMNTVLNFSSLGLEKIGIKKATLYFSSSSKTFENLSKIEFQLSDDKKSELHLKELKTKVNFDSNHFNFNGTN